MTPERNVKPYGPDDIVYREFQIGRSMVSYKFRIKGKATAKRLSHLAVSSNQVWNFCVATQREAEHRRKMGMNIRWPTDFQLINLCSGVNRGARHGMAKLTEPEIKIIRAIKAPSRQIAAMFGVSQTTISKIKRGEGWSHV